MAPMRFPEGLAVWRKELLREGGELWGVLEYVQGSGALRVMDPNGDPLAAYDPGTHTTTLEDGSSQGGFFLHTAFTEGLFDSLEAELVEDPLMEGPEGLGVPNKSHRFRRILSRGVLVLDEGLEELEGPLAARNFRVLRLSDALAKGLDLPTILADRVLLTQKAEAFIPDIPAFEYSVADFQYVSGSPDSLASLFSRLWSQLRLRDKHAYLLSLHPSGRHRLRRPHPY